MKKISSVRAILSLNRGLLGEVSPALRAAQIKWDQELIHLFFYYDGEISEEDHEAAECAATEVMADFPEYHYEIDILQWDYPKPIPKEGELVYYRREVRPNKSQPQNWLKFNESDPKIFLRVKTLLSIIDGLLGEVSPALRKTSISWDQQKIHLYFYYDGEISNEDNESSKRIGAKVISNFPEHQLKIDRLRWDYPRWFPDEATETVYRKKEPAPENDEII